VSETFLDGKVVVTQPEQGFRSGLDAVMLAASIPARSGDSALELGAGAGTASLCLMARVQDIALTGVEIDPSLVELASANAAANGLQARFVAADIFCLPPELKSDFDQVFCNPPFHGEGQVSPDAARAKALSDGGQLSDWLRLGLQRTVSGGFFTTIIRADRLAQALAALSGEGAKEGISVLPLWPKAGEPAKRVIVQVRKASRAPFVLLPGLVLHQQNGASSPEAEAVLRRGAALALSGARL